MRKLTDSEKKIVEKGWLYHLGNRTPKAVDFDFYEAGFIAALEYSDAQLVALQAERDGLAVDNERLRAALKPFAEYAATLTNWDSDPVIVARWRGVIVTAGDFRKVAEVLGEPPTT